MTAVILTNNGLVHDDVIKWKHFPCYWPLVRGIHRSPVKSPHKGQRCGALIFVLWSATWIKEWVNNGEADDLRRHRAHYDATVMFFIWHMYASSSLDVLTLLSTTYIYIVDMDHCWGLTDSKQGCNFYTRLVSLLILLIQHLLYMILWICNIICTLYKCVYRKQ